MLVDLVELDYSIRRIGNDSCVIDISVREGAPALYLVNAFFGNAFKRLIVAAAGIAVEPRMDSIIVRATGLDLLRTLGDEAILVLVNNTIASVIPGGVDGGIFQVPINSHGRLRVELRPWIDYSSITAGFTASSVRSKLLKELSTTVTIKAVLELDLVVARESDDNVIVTVLLEGEPVEANISTSILAGDGVVAVEDIGPGVYSIRLIGGDEAVVKIEAMYSNETLVAKGYTIVTMRGQPLTPVEYGDNRAVLAIVGVAGTSALVAGMALLVFLLARKERAYKL